MFWGEEGLESIKTDKIGLWQVVGCGSGTAAFDFVVSFLLDSYHL